MMCKVFETIVRFFLLMLKLQDINNKSARLLNPRISHATFNYVFWGFDEMSLNEVFAICIITFWNSF